MSANQRPRPRITNFRQLCLTFSVMVSVQRCCAARIAEQKFRDLRWARRGPPESAGPPAPPLAAASPAEHAARFWQFSWALKGPLPSPLVLQVFGILAFVALIALRSAQSESNELRERLKRSGGCRRVLTALALPPPAICCQLCLKRMVS